MLAKSLVLLITCSTLLSCSSNNETGNSLTNTAETDWEKYRLKGSVKCQTSYYHSKDDTNMIVEFRKRLFDEKGYCKEFVVYSGTPESHTESYHSYYSHLPSGHLSKYSSGSTVKATYQYDENMNLISETEKSESYGNMIITNEYDSANNVIHKVSKNDIGGNEFFYEYDTQNNLISIKDKHQINLYQYDSLNRQIIQYTTNIEGDTLSIYKDFYDDEQHIQRSETYKKGELTQQSIIYNDSLGNRIFMERISKNYKGQIDTFTIKYFYNNEGNESKIIYTENGKIDKLRTHEYEYYE